MKKLTKEYILQNKLTSVMLVKYFKPDWTDEKCDQYLWNKTCFPFNLQTTIHQLNDQLLSEIQNKTQ